MEYSNLSPEVDLLDVLAGEDQTLHAALKIFGAPDDPRVLSRARRVVAIYTKNRLVQLISHTSNGEHIAEDWQVRIILEDEANWLLDPEHTPAYCLRLTPKGYEAFVEDSKGFFETLFSK